LLENLRVIVQSRRLDYSGYGDRSFLVNGPAVWNSLPVELRLPDMSLDILKDKLKTFLFRTVY